MERTIQAWAEMRGYRTAWGPHSLVADMKAEMARQAASGAFDVRLYADELEGLMRLEPLPTGTSVVLVAMPRPAHRVSFDLAELGGGQLEVVLPPTYLRYQTTLEEVRQDLARHGLPGAQVDHLHGPCKALAARLGLVRYGRNNIAYAEGIGSYLQLAAFLTNAPLPERPLPAGPALLSQCDGCDRCRRACPTGAISEDRFLLRGEFCVTYLNESPGDWPAWARDLHHHSLVGCLFCQRACPANPKLAVEDTGLTFSARETAALAAWPEPLPPSAEEGVRRKLSWLGQPSLYPMVGRNLAAVLNARSRASAVPARSDSSPA